MTGFTLDTSGRVAGDVGGLAVWYEFEDLLSFDQGYVEALFAEQAARADEEAQHLGQARLFGFSDLHPETLAAILKDCRDFRRLYQLVPYTEERGRMLWQYRNSKQGHPDFPPLSPFLDNDGKVRLRAPDAEVRAMKPGSAPATDEKSNLPREGE